jgi:CRP-like cAMP-binding protein
LEGSADIVKDTKKGPITIMRIADGAFIGSMHSFLFQNNIRSATVRAFEKIRLGTLDIQSLSQDFITMSRELRQLLISLDNRLREVTDRVAEFSSGTDIIYREITDKKRMDIQYNDRKTLCSIENGTATVVKKTETGPVILARLEQGDFIDFSPFQSIDHETSSTVVFASKDIELKKINAEVLQAEYERIPVIFRNMAENILTCISVTTKLACDFHKRQNFKDSNKAAKPTIG